MFFKSLRDIGACSTQLLLLIWYRSRFANGAKYAEYFSALEKVEADFVKNSIESMPPQVNTELRWEYLPNRKVGAKFTMVYDEAGKTSYQSCSLPDLSQNNCY